MLRDSRGNNYDEHVREVIRLIQRRGYENAHADIEGYDAPKTIATKDGGIEYIPDVTAEKWGNKGYFEIANKDEDAKAVADKWMLLALLAKMKGGIFQVFAPRGTMNSTKRILEEYNIQAEIIKL